MKIKPPREEKIKWYKNKKFLTYLLGFFIIFIMIASALNIIGENENNEEEYNGFNFIKNNGQWITYVDGNQISFNYNPKELEDIYVPEFSPENKVYILYNPQETSENDLLIQRLLGILRYKGFSAFLACDREDKCGNIPIINCSDNSALFYFKNENTTKIYKEENCIVLSGNRDSLIKEVDRISYILFGVMQ